MGADKNIFSTHDVARVCRVTPMTVIRWIEEGRIPAFKTVGGHRRVLRPDLEGFCRARGIPFPLDREVVAGRILVADPELETRTALADMARGVDFRLAIELAADAFDAGRLVAEFRPGLVFLDQRLPGVDALDICARLTRLRSAGPAVVVLTAGGSPDVERAFRARGATACMPKPPTHAAVDRVVRDALPLGELQLTVSCTESEA